MKKIGIGADDAAFEPREALIEHLKEKGYEVQDYRVRPENPVDYPDIPL